MVTIDQIDFSKLKPYSGKVTKCFEQFCYQIAQKEFGHLGSFTPIDGSGGDGGVEFYLNLTNGEKWGWQCKFFGDTGRLSVGNRKIQIANSLETACKNHPDLNKWILCLKTDLTEDNTNPNGKKSRGEQYWFRNELSNSIPKGRSVTLDYWGESSFISFLKEAKHLGIRTFFFGELEFSNEWFLNKFQENFEKVKDKYDPELHSIDKHTQSKIDFFLFDTNYSKHLELLKQELKKKANELQSAIEKFRDEKMISTGEKVQRENFILNCEEFKKYIDDTFERIDFIDGCFQSYSEELLSSFNLQELENDFFKYFNKIDYSAFDKESIAFREASSISYTISDFGEIYHRFFRNYFFEKQNAIHFLADAAKGKTHVSCDIAYKNIHTNKPAIFITGDKFSDESAITEALRKILDIPQEFSFDQFIQALDIYGSIVRRKIPLIIDGLNETTNNRFFSSIWHNHLSSFISKISNTKNIILITTCRSSYKNRIWGNTKGRNFHYLYGFSDYETIQEAVNKYFKKYKLKANLFFASLDKFEDPIFLKIFCEIKNPNWESGNEVEVNIEEESTFDVFNEYLKQVNKRVTQHSHLLKANEPFIFQSLEILSNYLWNNNLREISIAVFYNLIDGEKEYQKDTSKADILIHEGLVFTRDIRNDQEYVSFTYDILAGYMISKSLIEANQNLKYFISSDFISKIIQDNGQHPLFEDVISSLCLLLPQLKQVSIHELLSSDKKLRFTRSKIFKYLPGFIKNKFKKRVTYTDNTFSKSIISLFSLPSKYVKERDINLVANLFTESPRNKEAFFNLSFKTLSDIKHPLNALFVSRLLKSMKMNQRDIYWTEYIRMRSYNLEKFIAEFENQCRNSKEESVIIIQKQHILSKFILWLLTSTNRALRDLATRALYYYGRKFPHEFSLLVYESLEINDPYVWERTLASMYGVAMAEHKSLKSGKFRNEFLPEIGKNIYKLIFKENAPYSTTHILARDYARRTIEISVIHHPKLLTKEEIKHIRPPYSFGGIRNLGEFDYGEKDFDYSGPIQMDFSNYTIGRIVKDGGSYSNPPEKQKVRRQIYWRIYDLGWSEELFKDAERALGDDNYYNRGRTERAKVERYGKKYSWIAYFENAGLRDDLGLLDKDWDRFRISDADIDPSFPLKPKNELFINHDLLGDRAVPLVAWYEKSDMPFIEEYLSIKNLKGNSGEWICLDGYIVQEDVPAERQRVIFIRSLLIDEDNYHEVFKLLKKQHLGRHGLHRKRENYYTFAGELYYCEDSTYENKATLEFETATKKIKFNRGELEYYSFTFSEIEKNESKKEHPEEIEREVPIITEFEVLLPAMEYNWESYHSHLNDAGHTTVVAKEIASYLGLIDQPQTFDLYESNGNKASINLYYRKDYNNSHSFVYIRKDLFDKFLKENNYKFVWALWGDKRVTFKTHERKDEFFNTYPSEKHEASKKIVEYNS